MCPILSLGPTIGNVFIGGQWIQQLHSYGLLQRSFRPPEEICALRALVRHRENLVRYRSAHIQHMQKALQQMNVQLTQVVSDITGVTGLSVIRAIVDGERDPKVLGSRTKKTQNRAKTALRVAAQSLSRSHSALGGFYRRMRAKHGPAKANVATAHKLARIVYHVLKHRQAYADPGETYYEQQYRERAVRNFKRKAASLGFQLVSASP